MREYRGGAPRTNQGLETFGSFNLKSLNFWFINQPYLNLNSCLIIFVCLKREKMQKKAKTSVEKSEIGNMDSQPLN